VSRVQSHDADNDNLKRARQAMLSGSTADYATSLISRSQAGLKINRARSPSPPATAFSYRYLVACAMRVVSCRVVFLTCAHSNHSLHSTQHTNSTMATFHPRRGSDGVRRVDSLPSGSAGDRNLGPDEEKMLRLVAEDDPVADEHFCQKAVERLVLAGKLEEALHFADASLPNGTTFLASSLLFILMLIIRKLVKN